MMSLDLESQHTRGGAKYEYIRDVGNFKTYQLFLTELNANRLTMKLIKALPAVCIDGR